MMERCETCTYWNRQFDDRWGMCELITEGWATHRLELKAEIEIDGQGFIGFRLTTRSDFGCVQHEPREDAG